MTRLKTQHLLNTGRPILMANANSFIVSLDVTVIINKLRE